jgi:hypothetical protein
VEKLENMRKSTKEFLKKHDKVFDGIRNCSRTEEKKQVFVGFM